MEKVEKKITRFRANLKNKRKLSLPVFINQHVRTGPGVSVGGSSPNTNPDTQTSIPPVFERDLRRGLSTSRLETYRTVDSQSIGQRLDIFRVRPAFSTGGLCASSLDDFQQRYSSSNNSGISRVPSTHSEGGRLSYRREHSSLCPTLSSPSGHSSLCSTVSSPVGVSIVVPKPLSSQQNTSKSQSPSPRNSIIDGGGSSRQELKTEAKTPNEKSSPGPCPRRGISGLRDCDSLENLCDPVQHQQQQGQHQHLSNGLSMGGLSSANATSLPHIHQLSEYEDEITTVPQHKTVTSSHIQLEHSKSEPTSGRPQKNKKTKIRRRRAYYRTQKDGRSKSLTHIDNLGGEMDMLLHGDSMDTSQHDTLPVPEYPALRRKKLSLGSKVSSSEYVTVVIEGASDLLEEYVPATRGISLRSALERLQLDVAGVQVSIEGSRTPLNLATDISLFATKTIRVRGLEDYGSPIRSRLTESPANPPARRPSAVRGGQGRFLWGALSDDLTSVDGEKSNGGGGLTPQNDGGSLKQQTKTTKTNNRWSIFPSTSKDGKMDSLVQQLDLYSRQGIPQHPHLLACHSVLQEKEEVSLEASWRLLVDNPESLDERQEHQQSAIWELVETEATYIHMLKVINHLFLACLCNLQNESILNEIDTVKLFSNIQEIYAVNVKFWQNYIVKMLDHSRKTRQPLDPTFLSEAFYKFDDFFQPYTQYCLEQSDCQLYCKEKDYENEHFKMYLAWCETQKDCNRLRLADILVQPMQRLTKYSLLLKAISKKTTEEEHLIHLQNMVGHVVHFVSSVNSVLRHRHEQERLMEIAKRIETCDVVETKDDELERIVKKHSDLNLTQPMPGCPEHLTRQIIHHGDLKLRDTNSSKMDCHVFLFTDLLLITKVTQRKAEKVKIIRPPYHVARLILVDVKDALSIGLVSVSEWNVAVATFTLICSDQRTYKLWLEQIRRAQELYREAQQSRDNCYDDRSFGSHITPRSPRLGSSRGSRVSSLAHSHSGSTELNETSPISSIGGIGSMHHPSIEMNDSTSFSGESTNCGIEIQRSRSLESSGMSSSRGERRPTLPRTPNTLSVIPPYTSGQSLPNLSTESGNSLRVPDGNTSAHNKLSPTSRGISYPPPSPRTLRRSAPVPQSRNPPLLKLRNISSKSGYIQSQDTNYSEEIPDEPSKPGGPRRISRTERLDNRRYHTAGAIDDIKKQDSKDPSIHKRLSLNYRQPSSSSTSMADAVIEAEGQLRKHKHRSCDSMQSSSGVSSTSSLQRSMDFDIEGAEHIDDDELEDGDDTGIDMSVAGCTSLKISSHISTTYIGSQDADIRLGVCSQYITQPSQLEHSSEVCQESSPVKSDGERPPVQIMVTEGTLSHSSNVTNSKDEITLKSSEAKENNSPKSTLGEIRSCKEMEEILLNDHSLEASDV